MRWDDLTVEEQRRRALPGFGDDAVVRTFDAPEALDIRFYEIHARSALNRVPERSRMPFRWTINPYRGCTHACTYCCEGGTLVLMADGRTKPIAEIRPGDRIYGTRREGRYLRYATTEVLDHWKVLRLAYRVTLADGTELITSGDHRFLTDRGWKHVVNTPHPEPDRPHLTLDDHLMGVGRFADPPVHDEDYRRGYVCGVVRGDGDVGTYRYPRAGGFADVHRFSLAPTDFEALRRTREYLRAVDVESDGFDFHVAYAGGRPMRAIGTQARDRVDAIRRLVDGPWAGSREWCKGFLAGMFDAEGDRGAHCVRIPISDPELFEWTTVCLYRLGFDYVVEPPRGPGVTGVRLRGGLEQALRFFHTTDPAITRKRSIEGAMVETFGDLEVAGVERLHHMPLYDITTGTGDFIANGVVSHNCFARPTHTYLDMTAGRDFEREIVVKVNAPELVRRELARPSWKGEHVAMGTNTDPYQWVEGRYRLMPGIWEAMRDFRNPCSVLTKSPLLLRDKDLLVQIAQTGTPVTASFSVPTLEEKAWRATEPHTPHPRARLDAVAELNAAGIPTGILIAPLMPGVNDDPKQVEEIVDIATEAGAVSIGGIALHLRGEVKDIWFDWLRAKRPDLLPMYEEMYARSAYAPKEVQQRMRKLARAKRVPERHRGFLRDADDVREGRTPNGDGTGHRVAEPQRPEPEQPALF